jgi:hypothetical protein
MAHELAIRPVGLDILGTTKAPVTLVQEVPSPLTPPVEIPTPVSSPDSDHDQLSCPTDISPPQPQRQRKPLSLLSLPLEIRLLIYHHLYHSPHLSLEPTFPTPSHCLRPLCPCRFPLSLSLTCRTLHHETLPLLLPLTTLTLHTSPSTLYHHPPTKRPRHTPHTITNLRAFLKPSPTTPHPVSHTLSFLPSLRLLELHNIAIWCCYLSSTSLLSADGGGDETMLNLAMFNVKRHSGPLAALCADRQRGFKVVLGCRFVVGGEGTVVSF